MFHDLTKSLLSHFHTKLNPETEDLLTNTNISEIYKIFRKYIGTFAGTNEYKKFEQKLLADKEYARNFSEKVGIKGWLNSYDVKSLLEHILVHYIKENGLTYDANIVDSYYSDLEDFLINNKIKVRIATPIIGLRTDNKLIKINEEAFITQLEGQRKISFFGSTEMVTYVMAFHDLNYQFYMNKIFENAQSSDETEKDWKVARIHIRDFMMVLRLFRTGKIGFLDSNLTYSISHAGNTWQNQDCGLEDDWNGWEKEPFVLLTKDVDEINQLWTDLHKIDFMKDNNQFLLSAINRFMYSYEKNYVEDRIVDLIICLESLLQDNQPELRYRLAIRTALFLGNSAHDRNRIYNIIRKGYEIRNKTVHGDVPAIISIQGQQLTTAQLAKEIEEYARLSIKRFIQKINNNEKRETVVQKLDENLFAE